MFYLWQIIQTLRHAPPLLAAAYALPNGTSGATAAVLTGILLSKLRPAWLMIIAMFAFFTGIVLIATVPPHQIFWAQIFVSTVIMPFGMDMSFPSATIIVSDSMKKEHQGVAASLVNTIVNYSISLGLGFAGTIEVNVNHGGRTPEDLLRGYRGALYFGVGMAGLGLGVALTFLLKTYWDERQCKQMPRADEEPPVKA
jgi:MFS family permease